MNCTRLQELAAAYALGALERPDAVHMEALAASDPDVRAEVDAFLVVATALVRHVTPVTPPARVREQVLARIRRTPQLAPEGVAAAVASPSAPDLAGFRFLRPAEGEWTEGLHPGSRFQVLASNVRRNYMMLYFELDPGAGLPHHDHSGAEELFLIKGDLLTEGRLLKAGDFVHGEPGSHHHDLVSPSGCQAILVTPLTSAMGEAAKLGWKRATEKVMGGLGLGAK
jgi:anti-sigma factor ChrR (cupin superfamily)